MNTEIPESAYALAKIQQVDAGGALALVKAWSIETSEDYAKASEFLRQIKGKQKEFKAGKDSLVKPLRGVIKEISEMFSPPLTMLSEAEEHLKGELQRHRKESVREHERGLTDAQTPQEVAAAVKILVEEPEGLTERAVWRWEIQNTEIIPKEYWVLDEQRIGREARQHKEELCIPGIRVRRDTTLAVRAK